MLVVMGLSKRLSDPKQMGMLHRKNLKVRKNQRAKREVKVGLESGSKTNESSPYSRRISHTSEEESTTEGDELDAACMTIPEKLHKTSVTFWSELTTCCADLDKATVTEPPCGEAKRRNVCLKSRDAISGEMECRQGQSKRFIEGTSYERDCYRTEFGRFLGFSKQYESGNLLSCLACQKKYHIIEYLKTENEVLTKENICLMSRLEEGANRYDVESPIGKCCKTSCKRTERERDLLKLDEETECLREKIKSVNDNNTRNYLRFQEQPCEYEPVINKLQGNKTELMKGQGIRRVSITTLEEKVEMYSNLLKIAKEEAHIIKMQYGQLKKLHEQCDKALLDTQVQLIEVETKLSNYQNEKAVPEIRRSSKNAKCSSTDLNESERIMPKLDRDRDILLNQLDIKTELLFRCQEDLKNKDEIISRSEEEVENLKKERSGLEVQLKELKEKNNESAIVMEEQNTRMKSLLTENELTQMDIKKWQTILDEKKAQNRILQAEVEQSNKEMQALATSNYQLQRDTQQSQVQVSVAMETVTELEIKMKQMEGLVAEYENETRQMKSDLDDSRIAINLKEMEISNLFKIKNNLQNVNEQLDMKNKAREKTICDLECECQQLKTNLRSLESKKRMMSDLSSETDEIKAQRDALEKENSNLFRRVKKLENKLFQCICSICDNAKEKCTMANFIFKDCTDTSSQHKAMLTKTREVGIQTFCKTSFRTSTNSIQQAMEDIPLTNEYSGSLDRSRHCKKDTIMSSIYKTLDPTPAFNYKALTEAENQIKKKSSLNFIVEENSSELLNNSNEKEKNCHVVGGRQKYIIDKVTSVCKIIQVGNEERIFRRVEYDGGSDISKCSSPQSPKNV